ncbi:protein kinase-like domain, concanavalin A-like lectin/glucanase domain protein [Tanacetum coccineum]
MEQYLALTRGNQAPGVVKPENRGNVNFEIKSQFMWELREDSFSRNKNDDAHEHVERVLDIVSLFPGVSHDAVMLRVFPITLTGAAKRWVDRLPPRTVDSWDLLKKAFIQRYCPPSKTAKQLEEIRNFKQEGDETLYQAWEWYNDLLCRCPTHDINNHQKEVDNQPKKTEIPSQNEKLCNREKEKTEQNQAKILTFALVKGIWLRFAFVLFYMYTITRTTPVQALTAIQTMSDHSKKWHDGSSNRNIESSSNFEGIAAIVNKLENLGRDMKKLKKNVHAIQKFYQSTEASRETHDKIIQGLEGKVKTLANEVEGRANNKKFEECKTIYSENGLPLYTPFYYSHEEIEYFSTNSGFSDNEEQETDDSRMTEAVAALEATLKKKREEPKKVKQNVNYYVDPYEPPIPFPKRLEHHAEEALVHQTMESLKKIKINRPLLKEIRQADNYTKQMKYLVENKPRTKEDNEIRMNPRFQKCISRLGASISIMPFSMYKRLGIGKLEPINMLIEMADNTKCAPKGIVENLLIKIDKFIFHVDMVEDIRMPIILGRPLLATAHAQVDILKKTISLEVGSEKVIFKMRSSFTTTKFEYVRSIKSETFVEDDNLKEIDYDLFIYDSES